MQAVGEFYRLQFEARNRRMKGRWHIGTRRAFALGMRFLVASVVAAGCLALSQPAKAATITIEPCLLDAAIQCVTGLQGVEIDGTLYDVTFAQGSYEAAYGSAPPPFWGSQAEAIQAAFAIRAWIEPSAAQSFVGAAFDAVLFPYALTSSALDVYYLQWIDTTGFVGIFPCAECYTPTFDGTAHRPASNVAYVVLTPSETESVPDAGATIFLFAAALTSLAVVRLRLGQ